MAKSKFLERIRYYFYVDIPSDVFFEFHKLFLTNKELKRFQSK